MKLAIVTDHRFERRRNGVWDRYVFDQNFWRDYLSVFEQVTVVAREGGGDEAKSRSDGLPGLHFAWGIKSRVSAIVDSDVVILRLPSLLAALHLPLLRRKTLGIELVGHPDSLAQYRAGPVARSISRLVQWATLWTLQRATAMSAVSEELLRLAPDGVPAYRVSSIRLPRKELSTPRSSRSAGRAVLVIGTASPLKRIALAGEAVNGVRLVDERFHLLLVGAGHGEIARAFPGAVDLGHVSDRRRLRGIIDSAEFGLVTSVVEGLPRVALEMQSRGVPVLGVDAPGVREAIPADALVPDDERCAGNIASKLLAYASSDDTYARASAAAIDHVQEFVDAKLSPKRREMYALLKEAAAAS